MADQTNVDIEANLRDCVFSYYSLAGVESDIVLKFRVVDSRDFSALSDISLKQVISDMRDVTDKLLEAPIPPRVYQSAASQANEYESRARHILRKRYESDMQV